MDVHDLAVLMEAAEDASSLGHDEFTLWWATSPTAARSVVVRAVIQAQKEKASPGIIMMHQIHAFLRELWTSTR